MCECALRDSANYLAHINGRKHNRMLGMSMRAERSTLAEVRARLQAHKDDDALKQELSPEEKAELFLQQFDERVREREEAEREEAREKRRRDKERRAGAAPRRRPATRRRPPAAARRPPPRPTRTTAAWRRWASTLAASADRARIISYAAIQFFQRRAHQLASSS